MVPVQNIFSSYLVPFELVIIIIIIIITTIISIYKLSDVGVSSNLIGSLSLTNGYCPPPGSWIMK